MIAQAFYDVLANDGTLTGQIAQFKGSPAIFTAAPVPHNAPFPLIVTEANVSDVAEDDLGTLGRDIQRDIRIYSKATGSTADIDDIAERVRELFHKQDITVSGYHTLISTVSGPVGAPADPDLYGRVLTVRLRLKQN